MEVIEAVDFLLYLYSTLKYTVWNSADYWIDTGGGLYNNHF